VVVEFAQEKLVTMLVVLKISVQLGGCTNGVVTASAWVASEAVVVSDMATKSLW
jgi:chitodextrinase